MGNYSTCKRHWFKYVNENSHLVASLSNRVDRSSLKTCSREQQPELSLTFEQLTAATVKVMPFDNLKQKRSSNMQRSCLTQHFLSTITSLMSLAAVTTTFVCCITYVHSWHLMQPRPWRFLLLAVDLIIVTLFSTAGFERWTIHPIAQTWHQVTTIFIHIFEETFAWMLIFKQMFYHEWKLEAANDQLLASIQSVMQLITWSLTLTGRLTLIVNKLLTLVDS